MKHHSKHYRQSIRLKGYDYSQNGAYFITICTQNRELLFNYNPAKEMVQTKWNELSVRFPDTRLDEFVIMPNHIHGIIFICRCESCIHPSFHVDCKTKGDHKDRPYGTKLNTIGRIVQAFKSITTYEYILAVKEKNWPSLPGKLWQRNYYEHIIRNEKELNSTRQYILDNPTNWNKDENNPELIT